MYTDLLIKIKNAQQAKKDLIKLPYSNMDFAIAELLAKNKYVASVAKKGRMPKRVIEVKLQYDKNGVGAIEKVRFVSKPSRRIYSGYENLRPVRQGFGIGVLSTPKGLMTNMEAKKAKVGGQLLFEIY
ncbi:MAG: 30S ribosomal protein S8 [Patescibacteria group bacterium]